MECLANDMIQDEDYRKELTDKQMTDEQRAEAIKAFLMARAPSNVSKD